MKLVIVMLAALGTAAADPAQPDAEARARSFLQHQIDAALADHHADLVATFTTDAIVLADTGASTAEQVNNFAIGGAGADGASIDKASIAKLVAHGTKDVVWFYADVSTHSTGPGGGPSAATPTRVVELITAASGWHAVAASFGMPSELQPAGMNTEIAGAMGASSVLAQMLASPSKLGPHLAPDAIAVGPTTVATSNAAAALASWKLEPIALFGKAREVKASGWACVQASFDRPHPGRPNLIDRGFAQIVTVENPDGTWSVVLVQYRSQ